MLNFARFCGQLSATIAKYVIVALLGSLGFWFLGWQQHAYDSVLALVFAGICVDWLWNKWLNKGNVPNNGSDIGTKRQV
mgnify:CR=1 FL=1